MISTDMLPLHCTLWLNTYQSALQTRPATRPCVKTLSLTYSVHLVWGRKTVAVVRIDTG